MGKKPLKVRRYVRLTAVWGNDDADSSIKVSRRRWKAIQDGAEYVTSAWSWYEGQRHSVAWSFSKGLFSIDGDDGMQCIDADPVSELIEELPSAS